MTVIEVATRHLPRAAAGTCEIRSGPRRPIVAIDADQGTDYYPMLHSTATEAHVVLWHVNVGVLGSGGCVDGSTRIESGDPLGWIRRPVYGGCLGVVCPEPHPAGIAGLGWSRVAPGSHLCTTVSANTLRCPAGVSHDILWLCRGTSRGPFVMLTRHYHC